MSRPANYWNMSHDERQAWERQERERSDLEYEREEAARRAESSERSARDARKQAAAERENHAYELERVTDDLDQLHDDLDEVCAKYEHVRSVLIEVVTRWDAAQVQAIGTPDQSTVPPLLAALALARAVVQGSADDSR